MDTNLHKIFYFVFEGNINVNVPITKVFPF